MKKLLENRKLLIIGGLLILFVFGVGYLALPLGGPKPLQIQLQVGAAAPPAAAPAPIPTPVVEEPVGPVVPIERAVPRGNGILFPLGERIVNLADPGGYRYLRIAITLEFLPESAEFYKLPPAERAAREEEFQAEVTRQKPLIDDLVISILSSKTFADIFTLEGKEQLKAELIEKLNATLGDKKYVGAVYFTDFVVQ
jgi:flagellar FliL protein